MNAGMRSLPCGRGNEKTKGEITGRVSAWCLIGLALAAAMLFSVGAAHAQVRLETEAFAGAPFGVGRVTLHSGGEFRVNRLPRPGGGRIADLAKKIVQQAAGGQPADSDGAEAALVEKTGRALYPVFEKRDRPILREFVSTPTEATILFLFQGDAPLDVTFFAPGATAAHVAVRQDRAGHERLLRTWWRDYSAAGMERNGSRDYPPLVHEYLVDTLSRRLRLPLPRRPAERETSLFQSELSLLLGTEQARLEAAQVILLGDATSQVTTGLLPEELPPQKPEGLNPTADVPIEPIAMRVPVECLYVRFGSFPNFLWLRHRLEEWGGQVRDLVSQRGLDYGLNDRMQRQLGLRESALAELLGERVIADVAIIGTDTFLREGAAIGMLFQAKSNPALAADLTQQRLTALKGAKAGKRETLEIAGHQVSFFSTADNSLRSFYVADGDFHLVTTSRTIVERFLATGAGKHDSLGASDAFHRARKSMPLARGDTVFVFMAPAFFENMLGAPYQIELARRLRSAVEMELFEIAQLAARAEQKPGTTVDELVAGGLLPERFGARSDGRRLELIDGKPIDSLRGGHGTFLPVPDVEIAKITPAEAADYRRFAQYYAAQWGPMDPLVATIRREALSDRGLERVVLDVEAAPLSEQHVNILAQWLGEPTDRRLAPVTGDVVSFEAVLRGGTFFDDGEHHLFAGLRDADPAFALDANAGIIARILTSKWEGLQGYVGAWPNAGFLRLFGVAANAGPDAAGFTRLLTGLWRRQASGFTLLSFHPEVLQVISPQLRFEKADRPAQIWFRADDLARSKLSPMINAYGYRQSRQITLGNTRFMNMLNEQLHVPATEARATAERLLDARLMSPLGGRYEVRELPGGRNNWVDTALADRTSANQPPGDYQFPALNWLRGIKVELTTRDGLLAAHGEFIMPVETRSGPQIPGLPFLGQKPAGNQKPGKGPKPAAKPPTQPAPRDAKPADKKAI
jgi:hypothetical protein